MILLLLLFLGVAAAEYRAMTPLFAQFMETHGKEYSSAAEHNKRFWIFYKNTELWNRANKEDRGTAVYGPTKFADLTPEEFSDIYLNKVMASSDISEVRALHPEILMDVDPSDIPSSVDWREHNAVTEVKNQGMCGSCWAFSTTGNVEGQYAIKTGNLSSFSEQELVDCDTVDNGCNGGLPSQAYLEIKRLGGLESEEEYPYKGTGGTCKLDKSKVRVDVTGGITLPQDEEQIAAWVAQNGPVSIGINAFMMQFYMGGIAHPYWFMCRPGKLDHGVLITGYGEEDGTPYWNIKNSWGTTWGEKGYYRIYRGGDCCGVDRMVTSATL